MLGGIGVLPSVASNGQATVARDTPAEDTSGADSAEPTTSEAADLAAATYAGTGPAPSPTTAAPVAPVDPSVPPGAGDGRRIVFSQGQQRVWLVGEDETVERTYLVSGSVYDNLEPGTYAVYSRSEQAWGIDDSGSMRYFVRFTEGDNGGAIGFHDIPVSNGEPVQTKDQLGTPQSHGCIRQRPQDAVALWQFAPVGTEVVVTA